MSKILSFMFVVFLFIACTGAFAVALGSVASIFLPAGYGIAIVFCGFVSTVVAGAAAFAIDANT